MHSLATRVAVDLRALAARSPALARAGFAVNAPGSAGVDLDGDPHRLRGDEFIAASAAAFTGVLGGGSAVAPADLMALAKELRPVSGASLPPASHPREHILHAAVWRKLAVDIPPVTTGPGRVDAYGGYTITKAITDATTKASETEGHATLAVLFPRQTRTQHVADEALELRVLDSKGNDVPCIVQHEIVGWGVRRQLRLTFDLEKMPRPAFLRWAVPVDLIEAPTDLSRPIPLPLRGVPAAVQRDLATEPNIPAAHPLIVAWAREARAHAVTLQELVLNTQALLKSVRDRADKSPTYSTDALGFLLGANGACDSNANLFAAIMRANGVPCRPVIGIQRGGSQDIHSQNEYFAPGVGWVHVEPQASEVSCSRTGMVQMGIVTPFSQPPPRDDPQVLTTASWVREVDAFGRLHDARSPSRRLRVDYGLFVNQGPFPALMAHAA